MTDLETAADRYLKNSAYGTTLTELKIKEAELLAQSHYGRPGKANQAWKNRLKFHKDQPLRSSEQ